MKFSYNWLKDYLKGKVPGAKEMAEILMFHSFEVEGVEKRGGDWILDIDILPNRAHDCLSHLGIAKEIAAIVNLKLKSKNEKLQLKAENFGTTDFIKIQVENSNDCPRYTAAMIKGVKVGESPKWLKERLIACGLQPINNIVDATNYVMLETGQPLHAFDFEKIKSVQIQNSKSKIQNYNSKVKSFKKIIIRRAKDGEKIKTLDDKNYELSPDILVIADEKQSIAIAGIKGGFATGIDEKTKTVLVEAANFEPVLIRRASQKLKLRTDASYRFENGLDPNLIDFAQVRACEFIKKAAGGKIVKALTDFYPKKVLPKTLLLDLGYLNKLLGVEIPKKNVLSILRLLGFEAKEKSNDKILVKIPSLRLDINLEEDLIEEVGRVYGYKNIPSKFPQVGLLKRIPNEEFLWEQKAKDSLAGCGFCEAYNYSFVGEKAKEVFKYSQDELVSIENPMSVNNKYLRQSLIPGLLANVKDNLRFFSEVKIFEIGRVFRNSQNPKEKRMLGIVLVRQGTKDECFFELKGASENLLNDLGVSDVWFDEVQPSPEDLSFYLWQKGKTAEIKSGNKELGFLGEINPEVLEALGVKAPAYLADFDFETLEKMAVEENEYQPISAYPPVLRDLALVVPENTKTADILNVIYTVGGSLLKDVDLFDVYSGESLPEGKENFAFHLIFQSQERNLLSKEVEDIMQKIISALEEKPEWEVRRQT